MSDLSPKERPRRVSWLLRILCHLVGADYERLASSPLGDRQFVARIGVQLIASSAFLFTIFASSLLIGFGDDPTSDVIVIAMAFIAAVVVLLVDAQIIQSDFYQHGLELARDRGFDGGSRFCAKVKRRALVTLRLALSMIIAFAFSTFFELRLFGNDILGQIETDYRSANSTLFQDVQTSYDRNVARIEAEIAGHAARLDALNQQEVELKGKLLDSTGATPEIDALLEKITRLAAAKEIADAEAMRRDGDAINELGGVKETPDQSGTPGDGPKWRVAVARAELARQESARLAEELSAAQALLAELRALRSDELERSRAKPHGHPGQAVG